MIRHWMRDKPQDADTSSHAQSKRRVSVRSQKFFATAVKLEFYSSAIQRSHVAKLAEKHRSKDTGSGVAFPSPFASASLKYSSNPLRRRRVKLCREDMMFRAIISSSFGCNVSRNQKQSKPGRSWTLSPAHLESNWAVQQSDRRLVSLDRGWLVGWCVTQ